MVWREHKNWDMGELFIMVDYVFPVLGGRSHRCCPGKWLEKKCGKWLLSPGNPMNSGNFLSIMGRKCNNAINLMSNLLGWHNKWPLWCFSFTWSFSLLSSWTIKENERIVPFIIVYNEGITFTLTTDKELNKVLPTFMVPGSHGGWNGRLCSALHLHQFTQLSAPLPTHLGGS